MNKFVPAHSCNQIKIATISQKLLEISLDEQYRSRKDCKNEHADLDLLCLQKNQGWILQSTAKIITKDYPPFQQANLTRKHRVKV